MSVYKEMYTRGWFTLEGSVELWYLMSPQSTPIIPDQQEYLFLSQLLILLGTINRTCLHRNEKYYTIFTIFINNVNLINTQYSMAPFYVKKTFLFYCKLTNCLLKCSTINSAQLNNYEYTTPLPHGPSNLYQNGGLCCRGLPNKVCRECAD